MTIWSTILLLCVSVFTLILWLRDRRARANLYIYNLGWVALVSLSISYFAPFVGIEAFTLHRPEVEFWSHVLAISTSLTLLSTIVRNLKPTYARYPNVFSFVPFLLVGVFPVIRDSSVLNDLLQILVLGAGVVSLWLTTISLVRKVERGWVLALGTLMLTGAYVLRWIFSEYSAAHPWTVHVLITAAIPLLSASVLRLPEQFHT